MTYKSMGWVVVVSCLVAGQAWAQTPTRQATRGVGAAETPAARLQTAPAATSRPAVPNMQETGFWRVTAAQPASGALKISGSAAVARANPPSYVFNRGAHNAPQLAYLQLDLDAKRGRHYHLSCTSLLQSSDGTPAAGAGKLAGARLEGAAAVQSGLITADQAGATATTPASHTGLYIHERSDSAIQLRLTRKQTSPVIDGQFQTILACEVRELTPNTLMP